MYIDLGQFAVSGEDIIGIFDLDSATVTKPTRETLAKAEKKGEIVTLGSDLPRTFVVVCEKKEREQRIFLTQISSGTLLRRGRGSL